MTLTPNTQNTPSEILGQMREEMPFYLSERVNRYVVEAMKLYATEKVKEALRVAAERSEVIFHDGTTKKETHHKQVNVGNNHIRPNRGMILSLETELVELINKEG